MPRLSEQEQQEVVRYIEAGKPLRKEFAGYDDTQLGRFKKDEDRAVERNQGVFHDVAAIEVKPRIYIGPLFDVGADYSMDIEIGDDTFTKAAQHS